MSNIIPFQFEDHEVRVVADEHGAPLFVGRDLCEALGYANPSKAMTDHCKGVTKRYPLQTAGGLQEVRVLTEGDMFRLVVNSNLPSAERFERLVFDEILPTIRKTGEYMASLPQRSSAKLEAEMAGAELYARLLRPAPSSQVAMIAKIVENNGGDPKFLPAYTIDAALDQTGGSSMPTKPLRELLTDHGIAMSPQAFNKLLVAGGYLEERTRSSSSGRVKAFKAVTEAGMRFGKNLTSPSNPRETQPHWYVERFAELYGLVAPVAV